MTCEASPTIKINLKEMMENLSMVFNDNVKFSEEMIGGKVSWLNKPCIILNYLIKIVNSKLLIQVGYDKMKENKKNINEMEDLCNTFLIFLNKMIDEYDIFLMK